MRPRGHLPPEPGAPAVALGALGAVPRRCWAQAARKEGEHGSESETVVATCLVFCFQYRGTRQGWTVRAKPPGGREALAREATQTAVTTADATTCSPGPAPAGPAATPRPRGRWS